MYLSGSMDGSDWIVFVCVGDAEHSHDRVTNGEQPACAAACTTGAITYGRRTELIAQAEERVADLHQHNTETLIYGIDELDGLHVMYVLDSSPEVYGLPAKPEVPAAGTVRNVLKWVGSDLKEVILKFVAENPDFQLDQVMDDLQSLFKKDQVIIRIQPRR